MSDRVLQEAPFITIVIPCLNESKFISLCLQSIVDQNYPKDKYEVLVVDGMSTDGTRDIIKKFTEEYDNVELIDNPKQATPNALNIGINRSKADYISRIDAHASVHEDYLKNCVRTMAKTGADCVGGCMTTEGQGYWGRLISYVLSSVFGVGASFRTYRNYRGYVDTVAFGLYKKEALLQAGLFKEEMTRSQDWETSRAIVEQGGTIYFDPSIRTTYYCEDNVIRFLKKSFINGSWVASLPEKAALRHLAPTFMIAVITIAIFLCSRRNGTLLYELLPLTIVLGPYYLLAVFYSLRTVITNGFVSLLIVPFLFIALHISYGLGTIFGLLTGLWLRKSRDSRSEALTGK